VSGAGSNGLRRLPKRRHLSWTVSLGLLIVLFIFGAIRFPGFVSGQVVLDLFVDNAYLIVLAVGMTFVVISGGLDLSVGSVLGLSTVIAAALLRAHWSPGAVIIVVLLVGSALGLLVGLGIHYLSIQPFVATLISMFFARGLCYVLSPDSIAISDPFFLGMAQAQLPVGFGLEVSPSVPVALLVVLAGVLVLHWTMFGRTVYAVGNGGRAASLMGVPVARTVVLVYVISGFCAALAGILFSFYTLSGYSLTGVGLELDTIAAVVIGGTVLSGGSGYLWGSILGVLVLGTVNALITFDGTLGTWWSKIIAGALLLVFVLVQRLVLRRRRADSGGSKPEEPGARARAWASDVGRGGLRDG